MTPPNMQHMQAPRRYLQYGVNTRSPTISCLVPVVQVITAFPSGYASTPSCVVGRNGSWLGISMRGNIQGPAATCRSALNTTRREVHNREAADDLAPLGRVQGRGTLRVVGLRFRGPWLSDTTPPTTSSSATPGDEPDSTLTCALRPQSLSVSLDRLPYSQPIRPTRPDATIFLLSRSRPASRSWIPWLAVSWPTALGGRAEANPWNRRMPSGHPKQALLFVFIFGTIFGPSTTCHPIARFLYTCRYTEGIVPTWAPCYDLPENNPSRPFCSYHKFCARRVSSAHETGFCPNQRWNSTLIIPGGLFPKPITVGVLSLMKLLYGESARHVPFSAGPGGGRASA
ncbi:hypothetical protein QBC40DRAFT_329563 [Triangularia verruculosa]|uniref:Uncharacterized protein n=1 Tax=Triangularia verruculosa TaxID=2587418 RepID=A0AAN7ATV4_9PEZI|nr:hypothetical protein QBC40DRAFT_329563 [Triangularia verruculosa]